ncbi:hypothetical protein GQ42DRAFT_181906 [Ramicandelaber brevisporus]|nr:hypothetical protein GQ42DRAFT_181906 [Ramicandelaber brevisporus]
MVVIIRLLFILLLFYCFILCCFLFCRNWPPRLTGECQTTSRFSETCRCRTEAGSGALVSDALVSDVQVSGIQIERTVLAVSAASACAVVEQQSSRNGCGISTGSSTSTGCNNIGCNSYAVTAIANAITAIVTAITANTAIIATMLSERARRSAADGGG